MKNKLTRIAMVLTVAGVMAVGPVAFAETTGTSPEEGKGYSHDEGREFMKGLNLTKEQKEKLKAQREAGKESNKAAHEQLKAKMMALHEMISKPDSKRADVEGLVGEVNALKAQMFSQRIDGLFAMKGILTPEQFAKMQAQQKERMNKRHDGFGKRHSESKED